MIRLLFGSSAITNEGNPIVRADTSESCAAENGYVNVKISDMIARHREKIFFTR